MTDTSIGIWHRLKGITAICLLIALILGCLWVYRYPLFYSYRVARLRHSGDGNAVLDTADALDPIGKNITELLVETYDDKSEDLRVRTAAGSVLSHADPALAERTFVRHLQSDDHPSVRLAIINLWALGAIGHVDKVIQLVKSEDSSLREAVVTYLGSVPGNQATALLRAIEKTDPSEQVRKAASSSLAEQQRKR